MLTSPICVDASFVIRLIMGADDQSRLLRSIWEHWESGQRQVVAPYLFQYEVTNALYKYQRAGVRSASVVAQALEYALSLPFQFHDEPGIHVHAIRLAAQFRLPATYDAHYLALADRLGCEFWTADRKLFNSVKEGFPWIHLINTPPTNGVGHTG